MIKVLTFGTFDLFHYGHLQLLYNCSRMGELYIGVNSDRLVVELKCKPPIICQDQRLKIVRAVGFVFGAFIVNKFMEIPEEHLDAEYIVLGNDLVGKTRETGIKTLFLPRTPDISTTIIKQRVYEQQNSGHI